MAEEKSLGESIEARERAYIEGQKLLFDIFKHLTTVSTGSILILVAFIEKVFSTPRWKMLVAVSFTGFIVSIIGSLILMSMISTDMRTYGKEEVIGENAGLISFAITILAFAVGVSSLVIFALRNFY